ncbi:MAG: UvrD-helicase domain-containing protein [Clostridia bacterium]|nr:UvrD-helicase domain-containing protein [Clostridia bacterium]
MSKVTSEQLEVIEHGAGNILVSASAGSGKTHTMIERLKRLIIEEKVGVKEILAVTFTEASASDMKEKIRSALVLRAGEVDDKRLHRLIDELPTADISTMHAFCGRLIRSYFFVAGVSPDFKILDQTDADSLKKTAIEKTFKYFYDLKDEWFLTLVDRHASGRTDKGLKELILSIYDFCDSEAQPDLIKNACLEFYGIDGAIKLSLLLKEQLDFDLNILKERLVPVISAFRESGAVKGLAFSEELYKTINALISAPDIYAVKPYAEYKLRLDVERKLSPALVEMKEIASEVRDDLTKIIKRYLSSVGDSVEQDGEKLTACANHARNLVSVVNKFTEIYAQEKRDENGLDFNDLEHFTLKILSDKEICNAISGKYKYIFVDEYQDTNGVQECIIESIAHDNLFMVGDVKQSIYGFRGCRSEFFIKKDRKMTENGQKVVRLNSNFRSAKAVINAVNAVFNFCMTEKVYGEDYKGRSELVFGGLFPDGYDGRATVHFLEKQTKKERKKESARVYDLLKESTIEQDEENLLSSMLTNIIAEELTKTIYDVKAGIERKVEFGDIAILTRNRNGAYVSDLVTGLIKNGIPVNSEVKQNVLDYPEIKQMVNALKLVDCFYQDLPLASTLKSPIGGFSEEELYDIVRYYEDNAQDVYGGFSDAYAFYLEYAQTKLKEKLLEFDEYFKRIRLVADFIGARGVMKKLITEKSLYAYLYAQAGGSDKVERLKRLLASSVSNGKNLSVKEFLFRAENCADSFGLSPFAEENTVKVTTIHSSKGLEYPVVIVCGLERAFNSEEEREEILFSREYGLSAKFYDDAKREKSETLLRGLIRANMRKERVKEETRLFYVALTRATYSLHMVFSGGDDRRKQEFIGANRFADLLPSYLNAKVHTESAVAIERRASNTRKVLIVKPDLEQVKKMQTSFSYVYPNSEDTKLPLKGSVTGALKNQEEDLPPVYVMFDEQTTDKDSGIIAHKFLEHYDFSRLNQFEKQAQEMIEKGVLTAEELGRINLDRIGKALLCGAFSGISDKEIYREKNFLVNVSAKEILPVETTENVLLQGIIDLLVIDGENAEIIDYKYSSLTAESLKNKYEKQLDLYAYAVNKVLGKKITKKTLVNIFTGESVSLI